MWYIKVSYTAENENLAQFSTLHIHFDISFLTIIDISWAYLAGKRPIFKDTSQLISHIFICQATSTNRPSGIALVVANPLHHN